MGSSTISGSLQSDAQGTGTREITAQTADSITELSLTEPAFESAVALSREYARQSYARNTTLSYDAGWRHFEMWALRHGATGFPVPPAVVAAYIASMAGSFSVSTIDHRVTAIQARHRAADQVFDRGHPLIAATLRGISRKHRRTPRMAGAITTKMVKTLVDTCDQSRKGLRDRALLLLAFTGALRRSEIVGLDIEHVTADRAGLRLLIAQSKTDQEGKGVEIGIMKAKNKAYCPAQAVEAWLRAADLHYGPLFRKVNRWGDVERDRLSVSSVNLILKARATQCGLNGANPREHISPHGMRAGFITEAYAAGVRDEDIMGHTRHKSRDVMRRYIRRSALITGSPTGKLDL